MKLLFPEVAAASYEIQIIGYRMKYMDSHNIHTFTLPVVAQVKWSDHYNPA